MTIHDDTPFRVIDETLVVMNNAKQEIMRLQVENTALRAALERAESDLDVALERVRAAIAKVAPKAEAKNPLDDWE